MKNRPMKTAILAAALALAAVAVNAQDNQEYKPAPGYDRPSSIPQHQHVVYWNDSMDHYDVDLQVAADAYSTDDVYDKRDSRAKKHDHPQHDHKTHKAKEAKV